MYSLLASDSTAIRCYKLLLPWLPSQDRLYLTLGFKRNAPPLKLPLSESFIATMEREPKILFHSCLAALRTGGGGGCACWGICRRSRLGLGLEQRGCNSCIVLALHGRKAKDIKCWSNSGDPLTTRAEQASSSIMPVEGSSWDSSRHQEKHKSGPSVGVLSSPGV